MYSSHVLRMLLHLNLIYLFCLCIPCVHCIGHIFGKKKAQVKRVVEYWSVYHFIYYQIRPFCIALFDIQFVHFPRGQARLKVLLTFLPAIMGFRNRKFIYTLFDILNCFSRGFTLFSMLPLMSQLGTELVFALPIKCLVLRSVTSRVSWKNNLHTCTLNLHPCLGK